MTTIGARSIHLVCSLQGLAVLWWEGQAHPRDPDGYHADDFAKWLCETLGLTLWVIQGDDNSEDYFAELVGWHPSYRGMR